MRLSFASEEKLRHNKAGASSDKGRAVKSGKWREMEAPPEGLLLQGALEGQPRDSRPGRAEGPGARHDIDPLFWIPT